MKGSIITQSAAARDFAKTLWLGDIGLNLPEFAWLISCAVWDHYSFQCLKPMFFGYLHAVGSGELIINLVEQESSNANKAIEYLQCAR